MRLLKHNFSSLLFFEIIYRIAAYALLVPFLYTMLNFSVKLAGLKYLSAATSSRYFSEPSTYIMLLAIIMVLGIYILINITGIIYAIDASYRDEKTNLLAILLNGVGNAIRIINPKNTFILFYVLFVLPFTYTITISGSLLNFRIPEFFSKLIKENVVLMYILLALYVVISAFAMLRIFSLNYYVVYRTNYSKSVELSKRMVKKNVVKVILGVVVWNAVLTAMLIFMQGTMSNLISSALLKLVTYKKAKLIIKYVVNIITLVLYIISGILATPIIFSYIGNCFYKLDENQDYREYENVKEKRRKKHDEEYIRRRNRISIIIVVIVSLALDGAYIYLAVNNRINIKILYPTIASVTAHRGDSANAPENTMAAFRLAVENQADIIELDVRQTGDGEFVVMHDESLVRTTGVNKNVGEVSYHYISALDAGIFFSEEFIDERIPTLREVLEFAKENDVYLNIELKPAATDTDYAEGITALLEEYDYIEHCMVGSSDYDLLKRMKELNPDIKTLYIMHMAFGEFGDMEYIDAFSIRHNFISSNMVDDIHRHNKEVYAWTVNNEKNIKKVLLLGVDGIISDDPYNTKNIIYNANSNLLSDWLVRISENSFIN